MVEVATGKKFQYGGRLFFQIRSCYLSHELRYVDEIYFVDKF